MPPADRLPRRRGVVAFVLAVLVCHHLGTFTGPLGDLAGSTTWSDWIDLLTPYVVIGSALLALLDAGADRRTWGLAALGAVVYAQGHGIHLAANSISNARGDTAPVHLWDEVVGHYIWFAGLYVLVLALLRCATLPTGPWAVVAAVLFGFTHASNGIEGGTPLFSLAVAAAFVALRPEPLVRLAYGLAAAVLLGWGGYWLLSDGRWFPQPSELGWF